MASMSTYRVPSRSHAVVLALGPTTRASREPRPPSPIQAPAGASPSFGPSPRCNGRRRPVLSASCVLNPRHTLTSRQISRWCNVQCKSESLVRRDTRRRPCRVPLSARGRRVVPSLARAAQRPPSVPSGLATQTRVLTTPDSLLLSSQNNPPPARNISQVSVCLTAPRPNPSRAAR